MAASMYTLRPTANDAELTNRPDDEWSEIGGDGFEQRVIECCREWDFSGAHVFVGAHGPIYDETGRESNYCGWIDAR